MTELYAEIEPYEQGILAVDDGNLIYWETCGNPHGKPAVVLHGGPGSGCSPWHRRLFDKSAYRLVLFDQRNCGRSLAIRLIFLLPTSSHQLWVKGYDQQC